LRYSEEFFMDISPWPYLGTIAFFLMTRAMYLAAVAKEDHNFDQCVVSG
jgi:hypothetical protein